MGKKPQRHTWPEAKKLCRLNQLDIEMAKRLGFGPDALIRAIPSPKQKWKLPVKHWVRDLHFERFGSVLGENLDQLASQPGMKPPLSDEQMARLFGAEVYREECEERHPRIIADRGEPF